MRLAPILVAIAMVGVHETASGQEMQQLSDKSVVLCATYTVFECGPEGQCLTGSPDEFDVPKMLQIDLPKKAAITLKPSGERRSAEIVSVSLTEGRILLQGFQMGYSWGMSITQETGDMSLAAAGDGVAFSIFGSCAPL